MSAGIVDLRYVARLDLPLPHAEDGGDAGSSSSADGGSSSSESDSEDEARLQRRDTLARGPEARAISEWAWAAWCELEAPLASA